MPELSDRHSSPLGQLQLKHLSLIAAVAQHRQLSLAAHMLQITQPAASRTLAEAEARVGMPLFVRHPKGMDLTAVGESLARRARNVLDELADVSEEVDRLRQGRGGMVRIGAVTGAAVGYVAPAIRALRELVPDVELHVEVATSESLFNGLLTLRHDMILGRLPARLPAEPLRIRPAKGEVVQVLAHSSHPLATARHIPVSALQNDEWVMQGPGTPIRRAIEEVFLKNECPLPRRVINTASLLMVLSLLDGPKTVTAVSGEVADQLTGGIRGLVRLELDDLIQVAPYSLITLRDRRLSPAASKCRDVLAELIGKATASLST
jgi:DNA-binding transcriptional LysR family regulator